MTTKGASMSSVLGYCDTHVLGYCVGCKWRDAK